MECRGFDDLVSLENVSGVGDCRQPRTALIDASHSGFADAVLDPCYFSANARKASRQSDRLPVDRSSRWTVTFNQMWADDGLRRMRMPLIECLSSAVTAKEEKVQELVNWTWGLMPST